MADIESSSYSETDASNNKTPPNGFPSGTLLPSQLAPAIRALIGGIRRDWDHKGPTLTSSGTNTITLTYSVAPAAYVQGQRFVFIAGGTNTGATTLNVNSLGAKNDGQHRSLHPPLTADQYRARANFIRATAADKTEAVRQQLLGICRG